MPQVDTADLCSLLSEILAQGIPDAAQLMPYMAPNVRETLANDKDKIAEVQSDAVKELLFGWLDTWVSPSETVAIAEFYHSATHPDVEWAGYVTTEDEESV